MPKALTIPFATSPDEFFFETAARDATSDFPSGIPQENPGSWRRAINSSSLRPLLLRALCVK